MRLDIYFDIASWPSDFPTHDRRVVGAFFGRDGEVDAVGKVIAVIKWRIVIAAGAAWAYTRSGWGVRQQAPGGM
jgi:hypothetical protein